MAGKKSEERVKKPSLQGGVEQVNEIRHRAIWKTPRGMAEYYGTLTDP